MRTIFLLIFTALTLLADHLTVAAAANVSYAMEELARAFEKSHPDTHVRIVVGSSGKLTAQIRHGAPYDLFLSADLNYPQSLYTEGRGMWPPQVYAKGGLVLLSSKPRNLSKGLATLLSPDIRRIAVANPRTAPYGRAAREALQNAGIYAKVAPRLIYGENISQTLAYTLKAADAGLVARSSLFAPSLRRFKKGRNWVAVDPALYHPIRQGILLLRPDGEAFYRFILAPAGQAILRRYGYLQP